MEEKFTPDSYPEIIRKLQDAMQIILSIAPYIEQLQQKDKWLDGQEVMQLLHISKRTLQGMRDKRRIGYCQISGKFFYKHSDIVEMMRKNYQPPIDPDNVYLKVLLPLLFLMPF